MGYRWYHPPIDTSVCDVAWHRLEPVFLSSSGSGRNRSNQPANNQDKWIKINWYTRLLDTRATASCVSLKHTRARIESTVWVSNTLTSMHISSMSGKWCWWPTKCAQLAQFYRPLGKNSSTFALFHPVLNSKLSQIHAIHSNRRLSSFAYKLRRNQLKDKYFTNVCDRF